MAAFLAAAAPYIASAGLSIGQGIMANRAAKRQQKRMDKEAAQAKLLDPSKAAGTIVDDSVSIKPNKTEAGV